MTVILVADVAAGSKADGGSRDRRGGVCDHPAALRHHDILATQHDALDDPERFLEGDTAFHRMIHEAARNAILVTLMDNLSVWIKHSRMLTVGHADVRQACWREHEEIYRALHDHDPDAAGKAMRAHVAHVRDACLGDQ
jgi:DNA-binding FadR family transcriptional regulator